MIVVSIGGNGHRLFQDAMSALGSAGRARTAFSRAINHTGRVAGNEAGRALAAQTGLRSAVGRRALRQKVERSTPATLAYVINATGGDISLKHFGARETRKGVSAAPWASRRIYPSTFMKAGFWPKRVTKPAWNGQVFERITSSGYGKARNADGKIVRSGTKFRKVKSGLFIPVEAVKGATADAFQQSGPRLEKRVLHEVKAITKGVVS